MAFITMRQVAPIVLAVGAGNAYISLFPLIKE